MSGVIVSFWLRKVNSTHFHWAENFAIWKWLICLIHQFRPAKTWNIKSKMPLILVTNLVVLQCQSSSHWEFESKCIYWLLFHFHPHLNDVWSLNLVYPPHTTTAPHHKLFRCCVGYVRIVAGQKPVFNYDTPGTRVGPGYRDRTLAVKRRKNTQKSAVVKKSF